MSLQSSISALAADLGSPKPPCESTKNSGLGSDSLVSATPTTTAEKSSNADSQGSQSTQMSEEMELDLLEEFESSPQVHPASPSVKKDCSEGQQTSETASVTSFNGSSKSSPITSASKMCLDCLTVLTSPDTVEAPISRSFSRQWPHSGSSWNGSPLAPLNLEPLSLASGYCWLARPGALSSVSKTAREPGQTKAETKWRKLGLIGSGEVANPEFLEKALFDAPIGWTSLQESRPATELIEADGKPSEIPSTGVSPLLPCNESLPTSDLQEIEVGDRVLLDRKKGIVVEIGSGANPYLVEWNVGDNGRIWHSQDEIQGSIYREVDDTFQLFDLIEWPTTWGVIIAISPDRPRPYSIEMRAGNVVHQKCEFEKNNRRVEVGLSVQGHLRCVQMGIRLFVGSHSHSVKGDRVDLAGDRCFSAAVKPGGFLKHLNPGQVRCLLDSGAFSDKPEDRLSPEQALERQLQWEQGAAKIWGSEAWGRKWQVLALASYDYLIDETWVDGNRTKRRWSAEDAERAVAETIANARYLASQRDRLAPRKLILAAQGVNADQYERCVDRILEFAQPEDWIGFGGWCILGTPIGKPWIPVFFEVLHRCLPKIAAVGISHIHIFGCTYLQVLGPALWLCDRYGISISVDSSRPILDHTRGDLKKAGARGQNWRESVKWWNSTLANLRKSEWYQKPERSEKGAIAPSGSSGLTDLTSELFQAHHDAIEAATTAANAMRAELQHTLRCGKLLHQAKTLGKQTGEIPHGGWEDWLKQESRQRGTSLAPRTAQEYMRLYKHWPEIEAKAKARALALLNLTKSEALKLIAQSKDQKAAALRQEIQVRAQSRQLQAQADEREHERKPSQSLPLEELQQMDPAQLKTELIRINQEESDRAELLSGDSLYQTPAILMARKRAVLERLEEKGKSAIARAFEEGTDYALPQGVSERDRASVPVEKSSLSELLDRLVAMGAIAPCNAYGTHKIQFGAGEEEEFLHWVQHPARDAHSSVLFESEATLEACLRAECQRRGWEYSIRWSGEGAIALVNGHQRRAGGGAIAFVGAYLAARDEGEQ